MIPLLLLAIACYLSLLLLNPARAALLDGWRCVHRYGALWRILAVFGVAYALFQIALRFLYILLLPEGAQPLFQWHRAYFLSDSGIWAIFRQSLLPAAESLAGLFNNILTTYPVSAVAAFLLLIDWQGHRSVLERAVNQRFGRHGRPINYGIRLCAVAALAKPLLYLFLPLLGRALPALLLLQASSVVDWLSFLFEYLFGFCVQIYLILLAYVWLRGASFTRAHLIDFAIRRLAVVLKWAAVAMAVSTAFIHLPLILGTIPPFSHWLPPDSVVVYVDHVARPLLALFFVFFAAVQITLTFHSESLRHAMRDNWLFLKRNGRAFLGFASVAVVHFYLLKLAGAVIGTGYGEGTAITLLWRLLEPLVAALLAGWLIASWVCFYKRCESGRLGAHDWIRF